jgi:hypothetical protein
MPGHDSGSSFPKFGTAADAHNVTICPQGKAKRFAAIIRAWKPILEFVYGDVGILQRGVLRERQEDLIHVGLEHAIAFKGFA